MSMLLGQNRRRDLSNELRINPRCELLIAYTDQAALAWAARCADGYSSDAPLLDDLFETPISIIGPFGGLGGIVASGTHESHSPGHARHQDSELFRMDGPSALQQSRSMIDNSMPLGGTARLASLRGMQFNGFEAAPIFDVSRLRRRGTYSLLHASRGNRLDFASARSARKSGQGTSTRATATSFNQIRSYARQMDASENPLRLT